MICSLLMTMILTLVFLPFSAEAALSYPDLHAGPTVGETTGIVPGGTYEVIVSGSGQHFNVYIAPGESFNKNANNGSFAFFQEWSQFNVTYADINFTVPAGNYAVLVQNLEQGTVTIQEPSLKPTTNPGLTIPWEIVGTIIVTAALTAALTYLLVSRSARK